jgi:hypothetical protein
MFRHNWSLPIVERLAYLTHIGDPSRGGREQRIRLRQRPRRILEYRPLGHDLLGPPSLRQRILGAIRAGQGKSHAIPIWTDRDRLETAISAGATSIALDTTTKDYDAGGMAVLWASVAQWEIVDVVSVGPSALTISATTAAWPVGTSIMPVRRAILNPETSYALMPAETDAGAQLEVVFEVEADDVSTNRVTPYSSPFIYNSEVVYVQPREATDDARHEITRATRRYDAGGKFAYNDLAQTTPTEVHDWAYVFMSRQEISQFWGFLNSVGGAQRAFWMPSHNRDFRFTGGTNIERFDYATNYFPLGTLYRRIATRLTNGMWSSTVREITAASIVDAATETLTLSGGLPGPAERYSFFWRERLNSDEVEVSWATTTHATARVNLRRLGTL